MWSFMVTTVVTELQQVSTYTDKIPPLGVGPQHESGSTSGQVLLHIAWFVLKFLMYLLNSLSMFLILNSQEA